MLLINSVDEKFFTLNGTTYPRIYTPLAFGTGAVGLFLIYDTRQLLVSSTPIDQVSVNGIIYNTQEQLVRVLLTVVYSALSKSEVEELQSKVENLEENQYSGVKVYEELTDLPNPGELLVSYKVSNDTDNALNGFYHWDGAVYVKDASLAEGEVKNGDVLPISGGEVYNELMQSKKGYIGSSSKFISDVDSITIKKEVVAGKSYNVKTKVGVNLASKYFAYYEDAAGQSNINTRTQIVEGDNVSVAPDNARYIFACVVFNNVGSIGEIDIELESVELTNLKTIVEENTSNINEIRSDIEFELNIDLSSPTDPGSFFDVTESNKEDAKTALVGFNAMDVVVVGGESFKGSALLGGGSMAMAIFYDNQDQQVSFVLQGDSQRHDDIVLEVPASAVSMVFCWKDSEVASLYKIEYNISERIIENNEIALEAKAKSEEAIAEVDKILFYKNKYDFDTVGIVTGVITTQGELYTTGFSTGLIPVKPDTFYYLNNRDASAIKSLRCMDETQQIKSKVRVAATGLEPDANLYYYLPSVDGLVSVSNGQFKTSPDASYLQITLTELAASEIGEDYKITLEEVGVEYVSDFEPTGYVPYGSKVNDNMLEYPVLPIIKRVEKLESAVFPKVLLIGSSHGMNTIGQFPILAHNAGIEVVAANAYQGSLSLSQLAAYCNNGNTFSGWFKKFYNGVWHGSQSVTILQMLQSERWDVISLQRSASNDMTWTPQQEADFETVLEFITANCDYSPKIVFNSGFADTYSLATRPQQQADTQVIWDTAQNVKEKYGVEIIPMATALQTLRNDDELAGLGTDADGMLSCDSQHLDQGIGMYASGCICYNFFYKLYNKSILANRYLTTVQDMTPYWYDVEKFTAIQEVYAKKIRRLVNKYFADNE